jgi:hypothetical protein
MKVILPGQEAAPSNKPSAVERAKAVFNKGAQVQDNPVDANRVSPEDMAHLMSNKSVESKEESQPEGQGHTNEETSPTEKVETSPSEVTKDQEEPLSKQYAIIARKEKALRAREAQLSQQMKAKEAELAAREEMLKKVPSAIDESKYIPKDRLKDEWLNILADAGISYDEIATGLLEQPKRDPYMDAATRKMEAKIRELEEKLENTGKSYKEQQEAQYKQAVAQIERDAKQLVDSDPAYETIKSTGQFKEVARLIETTFNKEGYLMSVEEAAAAIEDELLERFLSTAQSVKKIQERLQPKASATPKVETKQESNPAQQSQLKTLTNAVGTTKRLSARERAIARFKGEKF